MAEDWQSWFVDLNPNTEETRLRAAIRTGIGQLGFHIVPGDYFRPHLGSLTSAEAKEAIQKFAQESRWTAEVNRSGTMVVFVPAGTTHPFQSTTPGAASR